ncbi:MAG: glycosyltransferase family 2 protein [Pseudomonadota bacterium]
MTSSQTQKIAIVIPCFRVKRHILNVLSKVGPEVSRIYVVDDCCPEGTGDFVKTACNDPRVVVIKNQVNLGVGGAVIKGYEAASRDGMSIFVKIDGDNQMDPALVPKFVAPILEGSADYTKGNRFFNLDKIQSMPKVRIFGNAVLSFMTKFSSGYWDVFDPTNGFTAIHEAVVRNLSLGKISQDYFFESDLLFRLNIMKAAVVDIPMDARYEDEVSNMKISEIVFKFLGRHIRNTFKRIFYNYYLRDMSIASIELPVGILLFGFGSFFGIMNWLSSYHKGIATPVGTIMLSMVSLLLGLQFILAFIGQDISSVPTKAIHKRLAKI